MLWLFLVFEFKLLEVLGTLPDFGSCQRCGTALTTGYFHAEDGVGSCATHSIPSPHRVRLDREAIEQLSRMASNPLSALARYPCAHETRKRLGKLLHWTYTFHVQGYSLPEALKLIPKGEQ